MGIDQNFWPFARVKRPMISRVVTTRGPRPCARSFACADACKDYGLLLAGPYSLPLAVAGFLLELQPALAAHRVFDEGVRVLPGGEDLLLLLVAVDQGFTIPREPVKRHR
jgi:hypothetical protein